MADSADAPGAGDSQITFKVKAGGGEGPHTHTITMDESATRGVSLGSSTPNWTNGQIEALVTRVEADRLERPWSANPSSPGR